MQENHLRGRIYHMTHVDNLDNIFQQGALLSQKGLNQKGILPRSIANEEVQRLRERIYVWDLLEGKYRSLHSYIPFYFARQTPMLRNQYNKGTQDKIVVFEVNRAFLTGPQVLFTDGNASTQQLSKSGGEIVRIIPITAAASMCHREYIPGGMPLGTNQNCSNFYNDPEFLDRVNWDVIYRRAHIDYEKYKREIHAEVLFPDQFLLDEMISMSVFTESMYQVVNELKKKWGITLKHVIKSNQI